MASRMVPLAMPKWSISSCSPGSLSPGAMLRETTSFLISSATCAGRLRRVGGVGSGACSAIEGVVTRRKLILLHLPQIRLCAPGTSPMRGDIAPQRRSLSGGFSGSGRSVSLPSGADRGRPTTGALSASSLVYG